MFSEDDADAEYIKNVWETNSKDIFLHKVAQFGSIYGTCFIKILPDGKNHRIQKFGSLPTPVQLTSWGHIKALYR